MLRYEEFEAFCEKQDKEIELANQRAETFLSQLTESLVTTSIHYFNGLEKYQYKFIDLLRINTRTIAVEIYETIDTFLYGDYAEGIKNAEEIILPDRDVTEKEKKELEDYLKTIPESQHAFFIEENNARLKIENILREHLFQCHDKVKESLWVNFPEIVDFEAFQIRFLNTFAYTCMLNYEQLFYNLAYDYIDDKYLT